jgi:hypothetical protein
MSDSFYQHLDATLAQIRSDGFFKRERNFCANNYLGWPTTRI